MNDQTPLWRMALAAPITTAVGSGVSASQIIQRIHEEASRRELHATHDLYRRAIARQKTWNKLTPENRRRVLDMMEGDFNFVDIALEDVSI